MIKFLITDQNFDQIKSRQETTPAKITTKLVKSKKSITISVNTIAPFAIYKWEQDGHFAISNRQSMIADYIEPLGYKLRYEPTVAEYYDRFAHVDHARNCVSVQKITRWSKVVIDSRGEMRIAPPKKEPFSVELRSKHGVNLLLKWLKKYLVLAKQEIQKNNFMPTLTGGLDTRTLTWFWRDLYNGPDYYLREQKTGWEKYLLNEQKRKILPGVAQSEIEISAQVLKHLNKSLVRVEKCDRLTFSGLFTDNGFIPWIINQPSFVYDNMCLNFNERKLYFGKSFVTPYADDLYLVLRHPELEYMRILLALLLAPDLLDIPLRGAVKDPIYSFYKDYVDLISRVEKFIQEYDLRKRVAKIKAKVLAS